MQLITLFFSLLIHFSTSVYLYLISVWKNKKNVEETSLGSNWGVIFDL